MSHRQHPAVTAVKLVALVTALVLLGALGSNLLGILLWPQNLLLAPAALLLGYLAADILSGTVHWFCDTFFSEDTPLIGQVLIRPFRDHHTHPHLIVEYKLLEQDGSNYFIVLPPLWLAWTWGGPDPEGWFAVAAHAALFGFALGSLGTNLFHKSAHAEQVPAGVRWLQRHRLILSPEAHRVHHRDYLRGYCVTSGWMNGILDGVGFFPRAECFVRWLARCSAHPTNSIGGGFHND